MYQFLDFTMSSVDGHAGRFHLLTFAHGTSISIHIKLCFDVLTGIPSSQSQARSN